MALEGKVKVENGQIKYRGIPCWLISRSTRGKLFREMHNLVGKGILRAFRVCGTKVGKDAYKSLVEITGAEGEDLIDTFYIVEEEMGWGKYSVPRKDKNGCVVRIENGWIAEALKGEADYPACTYHVGYFGALFSQIYGQKVTVKEKLCSAKGDPYCEFHIEKQSE